MPRATLVVAPVRATSHRLRTHCFTRYPTSRYHTRRSSSTVSPAVEASDGQIFNSSSPSCGHNRTVTAVKLRNYVPFCRFSSSIYSVPVLLILRMFYQAVPFEVNLLRPTVGKPTPAAYPPIRKDKMSQHNPDRAAAKAFLGTYARITTSEFHAMVKHNPELKELKVKTVTWVKALASPLSHEYIQFVVGNEHSAKCHRLVVERSEWGDLVTVGWDWSSGEYASHHHILPLPLLTLSFDQKTCPSAPTLSDFAQILSETSAHQGYSLLREMCWWFAEKVFLRTAQEYHGGLLKSWPHANLRYSFVVRTEWITRPKLVQAAEEFRRQNIRQMRY